MLGKSCEFEVFRSTLTPMNVPEASAIGTLGAVQTMNAE
jgi:hypothetical protein